MARIAEITLEAASAEQEALLRKLPPGGLTPFLVHAPQVAEASTRVGMLMFDEDATGLPAHLREALIVRVAGMLSSSYVAQQHKRLGIAFGLSEEQADAAERGFAANLFPADWEAPFALVETSLRGTIPSDDIVSTIVDTFGEKGLIGLAAICGMYVQLSIVANCAGITGHV